MPTDKEVGRPIRRIPAYTLHYTTDYTCMKDYFLNHTLSDLHFFEKGKETKQTHILWLLSLVVQFISYIFSQSI